MSIKKFKIEYNPDYSSYRYEIYRYEGWRHGWKKIASFESEEKASEQLKLLVMFPKYFEGDTVDGIYNEN